MGRRRQVRQGTSDSSHVRAVPVFNHPVDSRILARAVLAMALADADKKKRQHRPAEPDRQDPDGPGRRKALDE